MNKKLNFRQMLSISLMLFAIFFGAGNMIFPPALGQASGSEVFGALLGFIVTDAGIAILGIGAVVLVGNSITDLSSLVSKRFALLFPLVVYLLIGPLFALPRTGSVSFELALQPFLQEGSDPMLPSFLFTGLFFLITYFLSSNPKKIVDIVGKVLTPVLLIAIFAIFFGSIFTKPLVLQTPIEPYAEMPFFQGMIQGYLSLDGPAGLAFSIIVIQAIRQLGVEKKTDIVKYTCICGLGAAFFLALVYFALAYVGAITPGTFANGGVLLSSVTNSLFGMPGVMLLGIAVLLACLTTAIGLTTSFSDYLVSAFPNLTYRNVAISVCAFSFMIANVGLSSLIKISLPVLVMLYPLSVVLMVLSFFQTRIKERRMVYVCGMIAAFVVSFFSGLDEAGLYLGDLHGAIMQLPFYAYGVGWILPAIIGSFVGFLPVCNRMNKRLTQS